MAFSLTPDPVALMVGNASVGDGDMLSCEPCKRFWGTAGIVDVAGIQVKDGLVAQETLLVALRGRGQKNGRLETPD